MVGCKRVIEHARNASFHSFLGSCGPHLEKGARLLNVIIPDDFISARSQLYNNDISFTILFPVNYIGFIDGTPMRIARPDGQNEHEGGVIW